MGETLDTRSDVYSLGVMFYEIVSGQRPFAGETVSGVIGKHLREVRRPCRQSWVCRGEYQPRSRRRSRRI